MIMRESLWTAHGGRASTESVRNTEAAMPQATGNHNQPGEATPEPLLQVATPAPVRSRPDGIWWAWHPLHGGSTTTTLAAALPGGAVFDQLPADVGWPGLPTVLVCRSHPSGLAAAQRWAAAHPPGTVHVAGLVIVADAPGRLPRSLESLGRLVSGGYPATWRIPWVRAWRLGEPPTPENTPKAAKQLLTDLAVLAGITTMEGPPS